MNRIIFVQYDKISYLDYDMQQFNGWNPLYVEQHEGYDFRFGLLKFLVPCLCLFSSSCLSSTFFSPDFRLIFVSQESIKIVFGCSLMSINLQLVLDLETSIPLKALSYIPEDWHKWSILFMHATVCITVGDFKYLFFD